MYLKSRYISIHVPIVPIVPTIRYNVGTITQSHNSSVLINASNVRHIYICASSASVPQMWGTILSNISIQGIFLYLNPDNQSIKRLR